MPRYKLTIAYDGTHFCGWQKQHPFEIGGEDALQPPPPEKVIGVARREGEDRNRVELRTVAGVVERAVREIVREPINLKGSSRTDSGVHARGQVAAFTCSDGNAAEPEAPDAGTRAHGGWPVARGLDRLIRAINGRLPDDVLILAAEVVHDDFDPIGDTIAKAYSYSLHVSKTRPLWDRHFVHHVWEELDLAAMQAAAQHFVGEHDYSAFAAAGHGRRTTVRTVHECRVDEVLLPLPEGAGRGQGPSRQVPPFRRIRIDISSNGFLYNMVRIIAGTLTEVGRGHTNPDAIPRIIESKNRGKAGPTFPPEGLCLEWIRYP